ncbi:helicase-associated domain-containing protein [Parafrigoribacterium mesophilum]|uniref:helicase-associated domain-containing protein n=1 Tax=Parafrigoribacterium mesophilum TaxID=433646 RepID=UPI0031FBF328
MTDAQLRHAMVGREIRASGINDLFDLAEAFLDRSAVRRALTRLDRTTLAVIGAVGRITGGASDPDERASIGDVVSQLSEYSDRPWDTAVIARRADHASALLLLEPRGTGYGSYSCVDEHFDTTSSSPVPSLEDLAGSPPPAVTGRVLKIDQRAIDRLAADRAFSATTATAELLMELERDPARELAKGGVSLPDTKRLAHVMAVDPGTVAVFLSLACRAGLVALENGSWLITEAGASWLQQSSGRRWAEVAGAWVAALPFGVRRVLGSRSHAIWGDELRTYTRWYYPAGGEWMASRVAECARDAELLGVTANGTSSTPGTLLLAEDDTAEKVMTSRFPPAVETVYLQHDLSIVAPGPLAPHVDARLRALADPDSRTLASSYRISTASVNRALAHGESAESILAFLTKIAPTGIPQPVRYLIGEAAARYGLLRVGPLHDADSAGAAARSYLRTDHPNLLDMIRVDQSLSGLALTRIAPDRMISRLEPDLLFWALTDARYPVAAENERREIIALHRNRMAKAKRSGENDALLALIARLRRQAAEAPSDTGQAWLSRRLEVAIRERATLSVSVAMPGGAVVDYLLVPASVGNGRLRAHDRKSAIERTLPLSSIVSLSPAAAS